MVRTKSIPVGISLPTELIQKMDEERGDIPRSKYLLRIIQNVYSLDKNGVRN
jgi:metal-responsive CopG/Arc/MetJ family transcriptional regulator